MNPAKRIVIGGAGAGGLAAGWGLAQAGYDVVILEKRPQHCQVQSGSRGGQARLHGGAFYAGLPQIARQVHEESQRLYEIPNAVKEIGAVYFVRRANQNLIESGWQKAGIQFHEDKQHTTLLNPTFWRTNDVIAYRISDHIIDADKLADFLRTSFERAGGKMDVVNRVVRSEVSQDAIDAIIAETPEGEKRYACDLWINATGAWQEEVERLVNPSARPFTSEDFKLIAVPVLRCDWDWHRWSSQPTILQFYGDFKSQFLDQLSIIPIVDNATSSATPVAISTAEENPVSNPDDFYDDARSSYLANQQTLKNKFANLQSLLATALYRSAPVGLDSGSISWCVKSFLIDPKIKRQKIEWGALYVTVFCMHSEFGGVRNSLVAAPGKLGSVLEFRDRIIEEVSKYFAHS